MHWNWKNRLVKSSLFQTVQKGFPLNPIAHQIKYSPNCNKLIVNWINSSSLIFICFSSCSHVTHRGWLFVDKSIGSKISSKEQINWENQGTCRSFYVCNHVSSLDKVKKSIAFSFGTHNSCSAACGRQGIVGHGVNRSSFSRICITADSQVHSEKKDVGEKIVAMPLIIP